MKDSKFLFFWLPYDVKYSYETFLTAFYLAINKFPVDSSIHIGHENIFMPVPEHLPANWLESYHVDLPSNESIESADKIIWDDNLFSSLEKNLKSKNLVWRELLTQVYAPLQEKMEATLSDLCKDYKIEAIILWSNCPSIVEAAKKYKIPVIHNEMGPLREPVYLPTAYFDFQGVNGNTEAATRYKNMLPEQDAYPLLGRIALLSLFTRDVKPLRRHDEYDVGVPLQVEDDSNIIAFSKGFNNQELITYAKNNYDTFLIRKHPYGKVDYKGTPESDSVITPQEFISLSKKIVTINSSVGFEAYLMGKESQILGDSPFSYINYEDADFVTQLRFSLLNYLIPLEWMFDKDYYLWRLSFPSEKEIAEKHLEHYVALKHGWNRGNFNFCRLNTELENIYQRNLNLQFVEIENKALNEKSALELNLAQKKEISTARIKRLSQENTKLQKELLTYRNENESYHHELWRHQHALSQIYKSKSWKATQPLRVINAFRNKSKKINSLKNILLANSKKTARKILSVPAIRNVCITIARKTGSYDKLKSLYLRFQQPARQSLVNVNEVDSASRDSLTNLKKIKMLKHKRGKL